MHDIPVVMPYRLDLTVCVLRRLSTNVVDLFTPQGMYLRALSGFSKPVIVRVVQRAHARSLSVGIEGETRNDAAVLGLVRQMLGTDCDLRKFYRAAAHIRWLAPLVKRMRGVKPPRYPSLWEACVNAVVFQQISLRAAAAAMQRLIVAVGSPVQAAGIPVELYPFPPPENFQRASSARIGAVGLSAAKIATLRRVADALSSGTLDAAALERCSSPDAAAVLRRIKGIGPWTAAVILLRGLGRLDVFPLNDTSVAKNIAPIAGSAPVDAERLLKDLGPQHGMLYFHLLLGRLEARGELGRQSLEIPPRDARADQASRRRS